jgi:pimeloyl-ACP methyl ester carboxylesterase
VVRVTEKIFEELRIPLAGSARSIEARLWGRGENIVVLSGAESDGHDAWEPLIEAADTDCYAIVTYTCPDGTDAARALGEVLDFIESGERPVPADRVILLGASLGGVASLRAASERGDERIVAVVAISVPAERDGERLCSDADLRMITAPKLFITTEFDDIVEETRNVFAVVEDPRHITIYPGGAHGTEIFREHTESLAGQLTEYIEWAFRR